MNYDNSPPELVAALKAKPLEGEAYEKHLRNLPSREERKRPWGGFKGTMTLPKEAGRERTNYTPSEWRRAGIESSGTAFKIVTLISRTDYSATDLKIAGLDPELHVSDLSLPQALKVGAIVDAAMRRLHEDK